MDSFNPFSDLFKSESRDQENPTDSAIVAEQKTINAFDQKINDLIERIFLITINRNPRKHKQYVYMEDLATSTGESSSLINMELLEQALFERLLLARPDDFLIPNNSNDADTEKVICSDVIIYLYQSFERLNQSEIENMNDGSIAIERETIEKLILRNASTAMKQPDLFEGQSLFGQWLRLFRDANDNYDCKCKFLSQTCKEVWIDGEPSDDESLKNIFNSVFTECLKSLQKASIVAIEYWILPIMMAFLKDKTNPKLALLLLDFNMPVKPPTGELLGIRFAETLIGKLLCLSIMPKNQNGPYEYFENVAEAGTMTKLLWNSLNVHLDHLHDLFKAFLVIGGEVRIKTLEWIALCLHTNAKRGQIWNAHNPASSLGMAKNVPDSFIINLCGVLLRLNKPLLRPTLKVLDVDVTYCAVSDAERDKKGVHMYGVEKETCLISTTEDHTQRFTSDTYNFVTEVFYMTHKAIDLGYRVCIERFFQMNRELSQLQNMFPSIESAMEAMSPQMPKFLCLQKLLTEPKNDQLLTQFYDASALWLVQAASKIPDPENPEREINPPKFKLPLTSPSPKCLQSIPEFILENIINYMTFIHHFGNLELDVNSNAQSSLFTMILTFMGDVTRVKNPHLRARLAEGLESLLPKKSDNSFGGCGKSLIFTSHPHRLEIISNLLSVFVSIEMTGQSVQFEQKFNYRRPMYEVMKYLWEIEEQRECFKELSEKAAEEMEAVNPPIFLRFINLLINDAIFLLDESLSNLQQIRTLQQAQDRGDWETLPASERDQNRVNLQHLGMMARFDNILGRDTIGMLKLLTSEVPNIFCHPSMVDRVAAMLNYFLLHLVGPNKQNFKVKKTFAIDANKKL